MKALHSLVLTSAAHLSKILIGFVLLKFIALYLGSAGLGALGHFMSAVTIMSLIAGGGVANALIKYVSEYRDRPKLMLRFISASTTYSIFSCLIVLIPFVFYSSELSLFIFGDSGFYWLIIFLALSQVFYAFINLVTGVANGLRQTAVFSKIQIIGSLSALPIIWYFVANHGVPGAAIATVAISAMAALPAMVFFRQSSFWRRVKLVRPHKSEAIKLSSFTLMLVVSAISFPVVEIIARQMLINKYGYDSAGVWQGSIKLASAYLGFFNVFLAYYFMPTISAMADKKLIGAKTFKTIVFVMLLFIAGSIVLYFWRVFFISIILSSDFKPLEGLIIYQLVGDFFRISSYVIGFVAVAKAATKIYICAEVFQNLLLLASIWFLSSYIPGVKGVMIASAAAYAIYFAVSIFAFLFYLRSDRSRS